MASLTFSILNNNGAEVWVEIEEDSQGFLLFTFTELTGTGDITGVAFDIDDGFITLADIESGSADYSVTADTQESASDTLVTDVGSVNFAPASVGIIFGKGVGADALPQVSFRVANLTLEQIDENAFQAIVPGVAGGDKFFAGTSPDYLEEPDTPRLAIAKTIASVLNPDLTDDSDGTADEAGDIINYDITVTNTGNVALTGVIVSDPLLGIQITNETLAVGESKIFSGAYTVSQADLDNRGGGDGDIDNTATADSDQTAAVSDGAEVALAYLPDFTIAKDIVVAPVKLDIDGNGTSELVDVTYLKDFEPDTVVSGQTHRIYFTVTNSGNITLADIAVTDTVFDPRLDLTGSFGFEGAAVGTVNIDAENESLVWSNIDLAPGAQAVLYVEAGFDQDEDFITTIFKGRLGLTEIDGNPNQSLQDLAGSPLRGFHNAKAVEVLTGDNDNNGEPDAIAYNGAVGPLSSLYSGFGQLDNTVTASVDIDNDGTDDLVKSQTVNWRVAAGVTYLQKSTGEYLAAFSEDALIVEDGSRDTSTSTRLRGSPELPTTFVYSDPSDGSIFRPLGSGSTTFIRNGDELVGGTFTSALTSAIAVINADGTVDIEALGIAGANSLESAFSALTPGTEVVIDATAALTATGFPTDLGIGVSISAITLRGSGATTTWNLNTQPDSVDLSDTTLKTDPENSDAIFNIVLGNGREQAFTAPDTTDPNTTRNNVAFAVEFGNGVDKATFFVNDGQNDTLFYGRGRGEEYVLVGANRADVTISGSLNEIILTGTASINIGTDKIYGFEAGDLFTFDDGSFAVVSTGNSVSLTPVL